MRASLKWGNGGCFPRMSDPAARAGRPHGVLRNLVVVFVLAAAGSLVLVAADLLIGRPAKGDVFIAILNSFVALVLWRWRRLAEQNIRRSTRRQNRSQGRRSSAEPSLNPLPDAPADALYCEPS